MNFVFDRDDIPEMTCVLIVPLFFLFIFPFSYRVMEDCWRESPKDRPEFSELVERLSQLLNTHAVSTLVYHFYSSIYSILSSHILPFFFTELFGIAATRRKARKSRVHCKYTLDAAGIVL